MATAAQIFTILGILSAPMISIAALVLTLAALNWSLGVRKLYVKLLAFIFDYATKIKRDKELSNDPNQSSNEPPTPAPSPKGAKVAPPIVKKSSDDRIEITSTKPLVSDAKLEVTNEDGSELSDETPIPENEQKPLPSSTQTDIQFKLGTIKI
jgi:uncharacterized membrane protein YraQ (UPF0718 family)